MAESRDGTVEGAGSRSHLRTSYVDREQVIDALKSAFAQGCLTKEEFDFRVGQALTAYAELDALTADIPGGLTAARSPEPGSTSDSKKLIQRGTAVGAGASMAFTAAEVIIAGGSPIVGLVAVPLVGSFAAMLVAVLLTLLSRVFENGSSRQPSQKPPGESGNASQYLVEDGPAGHLPAVTRNPPYMAGDAQNHHSWQLAKWAENLAYA